MSGGDRSFGEKKAENGNRGDLGQIASIASGQSRRHCEATSNQRWRGVGPNESSEGGCFKRGTKNFKGLKTGASAGSQAEPQWWAKWVGSGRRWAREGTWSHPKDFSFDLSTSSESELM